MIPVQVRRIIEDMVGCDWVVAGGWAACPGVAEDCDVWITGIDVDDHERIAKLLADCFANEFEGGFEDLTGKTTALYDNDDYIVSKVGYLHVEDFIRLHIMVTDAHDAQELVEGFDVSTHAIGITAEGEIVKALNWTPPNVPPVRLRDTKTTDQRMRKIAARFGHPDPFTQEEE